MAKIKSVNHLDRGFYSNPREARMTMSLQELQETMMYTEGYITALGYIWDIQKKNLAPGVYLVSLKRRTQAPREARTVTNHTDVTLGRE